jgi:large repetitive protein
MVRWLAAVLGLCSLLLGVSSAVAQSAPSLGSAESFAVLAGLEVANSASTMIAGNVGVSPGNRVTGLAREHFVIGGVVSGELAERAQRDNIGAWNELGARTCRTAAELSGTLPAGVYCVSSPALVVGTLTLDARGDADAVWIFRAATLRTAADSSVLVTGGGRESRVFWQVDDATLGEQSRFAGNLLARRDITLGRGANVSGRLLAQTGEVRLDANGVTICCDLVTLSPPVLPDGTVGVPYPAITLMPSGGAPPHRITVIAGNFPDGVTLSPSGGISGMPRAAGRFRMTVAATDSQGFTCIRFYTIDVCSPLTLSPLDPPDPTTCALYSRTLTASGGTAPYTFSAPSGTLPDGLSLSSSGVISGTATEPGAYTFPVTAVDAAGCSGGRTYTLSVHPERATISPEVLPDGTVGEDYAVPISAPPPADYTFSATGLPPDLTLPGREIAGKPKEAGTFAVTITAIDKTTGCIAGKRDYTLGIQPKFVIDPLPPGKKCVPYSHAMAITGGTPPYMLTADPASLPPGLSLSGTTVMGTPTAEGTYRRMLLVTDHAGSSGFALLEITIDPATLVFSPETLPAAIVGRPYSATITARGAAGPYTFGSIGLPSELTPPTTIGPDTIEISGTFESAADHEFTVTASVSVCSTSRTYRLQVRRCPALSISPSLLPSGRTGTLYSETLTVAGGVAPYISSRIHGALPPGLTLSSDGIISGTPTTAGVYSVTVGVVDANGCRGEIRYCSFDISPGSCPPGTQVMLAPSGLLPAVLGDPYLDTISASGGTGPYTYAVTSGALPPGLALNPVTGAIAGVHMTAGTYDFTVTATDANGCIGSRCYTIRTAGNVPALSEWGLFALFVLLGGAALMSLRRIGVY